ncbi:LuxR C-terminal-related transcriptional regulator [Microbacterium sp. NPDC057650]|uniref:LuxR C-terminal-related transcriptional regulator n=1 Tax=unclassified Microbacterium TaxID=2609290 RepID=UPI00366A89E8
MYPSTKFRPPASGPHPIVRDDVLEMLRVASARALVVRAPAGYGKTTVVSQWLRTMPAHGRIWVSLDADDNDPAGLWGAIASAASRAGACDEFPVDASDAGAVRRSIIVPLIDAIAASPASWTLVLDDVHLVAREDTTASLDWFLGRMPENLVVVLITRVPLDLPALQRLRARSEVVDLQVEQLRLLPAQTAELLHAAAGPEAADPAFVQDITGGWPAAVALVAAAVSRGLAPARVVSQSPDDPTGIGALIGEGLAGGDPDDEDLLRELAVFERFTAEVLSAVLQDDRAWTVAMDVASRSGLIAALDDDGRWWRMHHLVREQLLAEYGRADPAGRRALHRRAAGWFGEQQDIASTVHHLLGAEDYEAIADVLFNVHATFLVPRQELGLSWLDRIPASALGEDPRLAFWEAWATATGGDRARRDRALARGRLSSGARPVAPFRDWDEIEDFIRASACYDDVGDARRAAGRFLAGHDPASPFAAIVRTRLATMLYLAGQNSAALRELDAVEEMQPLARPLQLFVPAYRALCLLELGDLAGAATAIKRCAAARKAFAIGMDHVYLPAEQALARFQIENGDPAAGRATAEQALEVAAQHDDSVLVVPHLLIETARADLALGHPERAAVTLNQAAHVIGGAEDAGALPERIAALRARTGTLPAPSRMQEGLSRRELEVLTLLPTGLSAAEIASELFISVNTARTHIKSIHRKLDVTSRADAVATARRAGLILAERAETGQPA